MTVRGWLADAQCRADNSFKDGFIRSANLEHALVDCPSIRGLEITSPFNVKASSFPLFRHVSLPKATFSSSFKVMTTTGAPVYWFDPSEAVFTVASQSLISPTCTTSPADVGPVARKPAIIKSARDISRF